MTKPFRVLPRITPDNEHFWRGGADGELRFLRCQDCGYWIHPPAPICPMCLGKDVAPEAASGRAVVYTFTVNHQPWYPDLEPPYVIAIRIVETKNGTYTVGRWCRPITGQGKICGWMGCRSAV
jgi:uncharacterized OB-fold protein